MKKLLSLMLVVVLSVALWGCGETVEDKPLEPNVPVEVPEEPIEEEPIEEPIEEEPIEEDHKVILDESNLVRGEFKNVTLDVSGFNEIKITIVGEYAHDIPVNMNNFVVDGEAVEYSGISGTSYVVDFNFKIGDLDAVANLMNTHQGDIRLHTVHHTLTNPHSLIINVEGVSEISFGYRVTTAAYEHIDSLKIELSK